MLRAWRGRVFGAAAERGVVVAFVARGAAGHPLPCNRGRACVCGRRGASSCEWGSEHSGIGAVATGVERRASTVCDVSFAEPMTQEYCQEGHSQELQRHGTQVYIDDDDDATPASFQSVQVLGCGIQSRETRTQIATDTAPENICRRHMPCFDLVCTPQETITLFICGRATGQATDCGKFELHDTNLPVESTASCISDKHGRIRMTRQWTSMVLGPRT